MDIKFSDLILHQKSVLTKEQCQVLIEESEQRSHEYELEHCPEATNGVDTYSTFQKVELIAHSPSWHLIHNATEHMVNKFHDHLDSIDAFHVNYRQVLNFSHTYRLLKYEPGHSIHAHIDHGPFVYGSCTFNLNEDYTGGEFVFFKGRHSIRLEQGDALIFPADHFWVHEVKPILTGVRYSVNSFLQEVPESMKDLILEYKNALVKQASERTNFPEYQYRYRVKTSKNIKRHIKNISQYVKNV